MEKITRRGWRYMSDRYIEKRFLYLVVLSVLLHLAVYELIQLFPPEKKKSPPEATMVDLTDLPTPPPTIEGPLPHPKPTIERREPKVNRYAETRQRVPREIAPRGERERDHLVPPPSPSAKTLPPGPARGAGQAAPQERTAEPLQRGEGIFKPKSAEPAGGSPRLFPSAGRLARLEDSYRKKYGPEVEDGDTKFLNTDDIQFGSFLRRLETAVYGVWHYPHEALVRGIEGTTPVRITFNHSGEIVHIDLLESSGSKILDDEVMRTLKQLGPIGSFPKGYPRETFKLIAFFHYGNGGGWLH